MLENIELPSQNEASGEVKKLYYGRFLHTHILGNSREKVSSVTSNCSLSFKVRELKFCIHTPHIYAKKFNRGIF